MTASTTTIDPLVRHLLERRGITDEGEMAVFLNPNYEEGLHDPFLLNDMDVAVERILTAIEGGERIALYTDYDTDGIPAGVILHDFLQKIAHTNFVNYIPHRHKEGYGLNNEAIETLAKDGVTLMVTADCGITDNAEVAHANILGIEVIVTDHHQPAEVLPPALAVINPARTDDDYPTPLCGCGVAFKLISAVLSSGRARGMFAEVTEGWEKWLLDMVAIATIADMVPLRGENRVLAYYGLKVLRKSPRPGIMGLLRRARVAQHLLGEDDVGFVIGPRINAASRMDVPRRAFEMLATRDEAEATTLVKFLDSLNTKRKTVVARIVKEAKATLGGRELREVIVIGNPVWQPGILGLAANSLVEAFGRPVFAWGRGEESQTIHGSCRSDGTISVVECMRAASEDALLGFGGHHASGGFSVAHEKVHLLEDALVEAYHRIEKTDPAEEAVAIDGDLSIDEVDWALLERINRLAPFGQENPRPVFSFSGEVVDEVRWFGKEKQHLELIFRKGTGGKVSAIAFFCDGDERLRALASGHEVTLIAALEQSFFMGRREIRLKIIEVQR